MIEIRTLDELRAGRTVIQITVGSEPVADVAPAGDELEQVRAELARTQHELARRTEERNGREAARAKLEAELATALASEVSAARLAERNGKIESLETKLGLAHADRANLKREVTRLEGELDAASRLAQSADTRRATAELRANQAHQRIEQLTADLDAATGHLLLRDGELVSANDQRDNWRTGAEQLKAELVSVKGERDAERSRAEQNKAWAERAEGHLATARASLMQTRHELATSNDNFVTSQNRVKELEAINRELVAEARQRAADPSARLYTAAEVADAQTSEAELVTAPLNGRIIELEHELEQAHTKIGSLRVTLTGAGVVNALGQVTPGTPGDVLAMAVRLARLTLGIKPRN